MPDKAFLLPEQLLQRCWERAAAHDRDNSFFEQDFRELKDAGYLRLAVRNRWEARRHAVTSRASSAGSRILPRPPRSR
jgi:hypothetical protein